MRQKRPLPDQIERATRQETRLAGRPASRLGMCSQGLIPVKTLSERLPGPEAYRTVQC